MMCEKVINNAFEVLAIELITIVQAIEYLEFKDSVSSSTRKLYDEVREIVPAFKDDLVMYPFVEKIKNYLINN